MSKLKLRTSPERRTINHTISSPTLFRISWDADISSTVDISNIGSNLSHIGYRDITISSNITFIVKAINANSLISERTINIIYQPPIPSSNTLPLLYQNDAVIYLQNSEQELNLQG
jgi:hypothetical protein